MLNKSEWTETDLQNLIGQHESYQLEFKSAKLLTKGNDEIAKELSQTVSAFANSAGGVIIIGLEERTTAKRKGKEAISLDGVESGQFHPSRLQQMITSNVNPLLMGVRVLPVPLSATNASKVAYAIKVPAGTTAYQACDKLYYGRFEFENRALPDHEIRMRMMRAKTPRLDVDFVPGGVTHPQFVMDRLNKELDDALWSYRIAEEHEDDVGYERYYQRYCALKSSIEDGHCHIKYFHTLVKNCGEITVRDFRLLVNITSPYQVVLPEEGLLQSRFGNEWTCELKLYPEQQVYFPAGLWLVVMPGNGNVIPSEIILNWKIFLDDAPPVSGALDLSEPLAALTGPPHEV